MTNEVSQSLPVWSSHFSGKSIANTEQTHRHDDSGLSLFLSFFLRPSFFLSLLPGIMKKRPWGHLRKQQQGILQGRCSGRYARIMTATQKGRRRKMEGLECASEPFMSPIFKINLMIYSLYIPILCVCQSPT